MEETTTDWRRRRRRQLRRRRRLLGKKKKPVDETIGGETAAPSEHVDAGTSPSAANDDDDSDDDDSGDDIEAPLEIGRSRALRRMVRSQNQRMEEPHQKTERVLLSLQCPGSERQANGGWTPKEHELFMATLAKLPDGKANYEWGTFSISIPGRVGYQCSNYYRSLVKNGVVKTKTTCWMTKESYDSISKIKDSTDSDRLKPAKISASETEETENASSPKIKKPKLKKPKERTKIRRKRKTKATTTRRQDFPLQQVVKFDAPSSTPEKRSEDADGGRRAATGAATLARTTKALDPRLGSWIQSRACKSKNLRLSPRMARRWLRNLVPNPHSRKDARSPKQHLKRRQLVKLTPNIAEYLDKMVDVQQVNTS